MSSAYLPVLAISTYQYPVASSVGKIRVPLSACVPTRKAEIEKVNDTKVTNISRQDLHLTGSHYSLRHFEFIASRFSFVYLKPRNNPPARKGTSSGKTRRSRPLFVSY